MDVSRGVWLKNAKAVGPTDVVEYAVAADGAGWDGVFVSDSITWGYSEPWTLLAGIATRTESVRLGTWITPVPRRQPWQLAHELATLDRLSDGRVLFGGGLGTPSEHATMGRSGTTDDVGEKYDEALEIIDGLWDGESVAHDGTHFTVDGLALGEMPVQEPRIPVVLGGWWPNETPFERAARWDGVMPNWPAMTESGEGPQGERTTGTVETELRDLMSFYHDQTDDPGEVILPMDPPGASRDYVDVCAELGATWLLDTDAVDPEDTEGNLERIRGGPPV